MKDVINGQFPTTFHAWCIYRVLINGQAMQARDKSTFLAIFQLLSAYICLLTSIVNILGGWAAEFFLMPQPTARWI